eukprot:g7759.t1
MSKFDDVDDPIFRAELKAAQQKGVPRVTRGRLFSAVDITALHERDVQAFKLRQQNKKDIININAVYNSSHTVLAAITHGVAPASLSGLRPIVLAEAVQQVNKLHAGCVMLLTVVAQAIRLSSATTLLLEDTRGDRSLLQLHYYHTDQETDTLDSVFPLGTHLLLLEPYMRFPCNDESKPPSLRCDNPQMVRMVRSKTAWQKALQGKFDQVERAELEEEGDAQAVFAAGRYTDAARLYGNLLRTTPNNKVARYNRAVCYSKLGRWSLALEDCRAALQVDAKYSECAWLYVRALCHLQHPNHALDALLYLPPTSSDREQRDELEKEAKRLLSEQKDGKYDMEAMQEEALGARFHCDYDCPSIRIARKDQKGRCVVAVKAIAANTLVMAAKAFVYKRNDDINTGASVALLPAIVQSLLRCPELSQQLYSLSAGKRWEGQHPPSYDGAIDILRIGSILGSNKFGIYEEEDLAASARAQYWKQETGRFVDKETCAKFEERHQQLLRQAVKHKRVSGLWIRPSMFNHSCVPNCMYQPVNDMMFIHTTRDVAENEELCLPYMDVSQPFAERTKHFASWNQGEGFVCQCERCVASRALPELPAIESQVAASFAKVAQLAQMKSLEVALNTVLKPAVRRELRLRLEGLPQQQHCGALTQLNELEAAVLLEAGRAKEALLLFQQMAQLRVLLCGTTCAGHFIPDNIQVACAAVAAKELKLAGQVAETVFCAACVVGPVVASRSALLSIPELKLLARRYAVGSNADVLDVLDCLVEDADKKAGPASRTMLPFCANCTRPSSTLGGAKTKMSRCSRCGMTTYCSKECQKEHWKVHKQHSCKPSSDRLWDHDAGPSAEPEYFSSPPEPIGRIRRWETEEPPINLWKWLWPPVEKSSLLLNRKATFDCSDIGAMLISWSDVGSSNQHLQACSAAL